MQRENKEPSCWGLLRAQEESNWSLSGAIAPAAIVLLNYLQKKMNLEYLPASFGAPTSKQEGYSHCSLSHRQCCLAAISCRNLPFPSPFSLLLSPEGPRSSDGMCWLLQPQCQQHRGQGRLWEDLSTLCRLLHHQFQLLCLFSWICFYFSKTPSCQTCLHHPLVLCEENLPV